VAVLREFGVEHRLLDRRGAIEHEPGLAHAASAVAGALLLPGDETGDAHRFTASPTTMAQAAGVAMLFDTASASAGRPNWQA